VPRKPGRHGPCTLISDAQMSGEPYVGDVDRY
jgi:hypothetical protein